MKRPHFLDGADIALRVTQRRPTTTIRAIVAADATPCKKIIICRKITTD